MASQFCVQKEHPMSQAASPETRPCPECGGQREVIQDTGPEFVVFSAEASQRWERMKKQRPYTILTLRCTNCGYMAFFMLPTQK
jgi:hypothetical protein